MCVRRYKNLTSNLMRDYLWEFCCENVFFCENFSGENFSCENLSCVCVSV